ncbi:MAG TPA: Pycsar system effector family protein [Ktedonobacteraceae bacterium]
MNRLSMEPALATDMANASELAQAVGTADAAVHGGASQSDLAMAGFGAGVHLYLNQLLTLIYSKTTTLLAANMVLVSLLLSTRASTLLTLNFFYIGAVFFFALSAITSTTILFPRLHHHDSGGLIFWRAILLKGTAEDYHSSILALDKATVEEEYAKDNWHISRTIRYKDALLRGAISLFICGMGFAVFGVVVPLVFLTPHH